MKRTGAIKRKTPLRARPKKIVQRPRRKAKGIPKNTFYVVALADFSGPVASIAHEAHGEPSAVPGRPGFESPRGRKPWRSPEYLAFVRAKPCCVCGFPGPSEAHHYGGKGSHGMGQKCSDAMTAPLCRSHHRQWHDKGHLSRYRFKGAGVPVTAHTLTREESEALQIEAQRDCLAEWVAR